MKKPEKPLYHLSLSLLALPSDWIFVFLFKTIVRTISLQVYILPENIQTGRTVGLASSLLAKLCLVETLLLYHEYWRVYNHFVTPERARARA